MTIRASSVFKKEINEITFGSVLRAYRLMNQVSQISLAKKLFMTRQNLCDIEKGRQIVSAEKAKKIAKTIGMSEKVAVEASLQDQLKKAKLKYKVELKKLA